MEYNIVPGFLKREQSLGGDEKLRIQPHAQTVDTVKSVLDKFRQKKQELQQRKSASHASEGDAQ
jgi:hypothetical protein